MEHEVRAEQAAQVTELLVAAGDQLAEGELLMRLGRLLRRVSARMSRPWRSRSRDGCPRRLRRH